jgi:hypothetical protein
MLVLLISQTVSARSETTARFSATSESVVGQSRLNYWLNQTLSSVSISHLLQSSRKFRCCRHCNSIVDCNVHVTCKSAEVLNSVVLLFLTVSCRP